MPSVGRLRLIFIFLSLLPLSGCLFRSHSVKPPITSASLQSATQQQLIDYINNQAAKIQSMQATVDIDSSVGGEKKGKVIIAANLLVIGDFPAMCSRANLRCCE